MDQQINKSSPTAPVSSPHRPAIGVMVNNLERDRLKAFGLAAQLGFRHVHTGGLPEKWLTDPERTAYIASAHASGVQIHTMFIAFDGQSYASRATIARTVGLVNPTTRDHRCRVALTYIDLAVELGAPSLAAHIGFLPENRTDAAYRGLVDAVRTIVDQCAQHGLAFHVETGQESADMLIRFLREVNRPNIGVNFDPANFVLYGTDEPLRALEGLAPWVRGVHCKDGLWPDQKGELGTEVPIGQGAVNFSVFLRKLRTIGYNGPLVIEREHGPHVLQDIEAGRRYLLALLDEAEM